MKKDKVAVVILNWNGEDLLPKFLPSVIRNSKESDVSIVVVDNCSTDSSIQILQEQFPEVKTLELSENYGFAKGYNEALKHIDAAYYVILNSDVEVEEGWLEPLINCLDCNERVAAVQPKIRSYNQKEYFEYGGAAGGMLDKLGYPYCRGRVMNEVQKDLGQYDELEHIFWASGACMAIRARLFHEHGGFNENFWAHMEEIDLCWRLKNAGHEIVYVPESVIYHLGGGSLSYNNPKKLYLNFRNNLFMLYRNTPSCWLWFILILRMILDGVAALKLLFERNTAGMKAVWHAHRAFYSNLKVLRRERKALKLVAKPRWHAEQEHFSFIISEVLFRS
ncbi:MAG: glycosyltransferase family 2 protein [Mangrovibacterium sp.]